LHDNTQAIKILPDTATPDEFVPALKKGVEALLKFADAEVIL
jgi:hypothetical protein